MYRKNNYSQANTNRSRKRKLFIKVILCIVGMIILIWIASTYKNHIIRESKAPYVKVEEVLPVVEAFSIVQKNQAYDAILESIKQQPEKTITDDEGAQEEYLTYGTLLQILSYFPLEDIAILDDYKKEDWYIGQADWNRILSELIAYYGKGEITLQEQILLGTSKHISDEERNPLPERMIFTGKGIYENKYWNMEAYLFSNVNAVCYQDTIVTIIGYADTTGKLDNVYLADVSEENIHLFHDGYHMIYPLELFGQPEKEEKPEGISRKIVDIGLEQGEISILKEKEEYVHGKLLQISEDAIEIEGYGIYPIDEDMQIYRLYGELASKERKDLRIGYSFTDFVLEDGQIAACLMMKEEDMEYIRVLLKNSDLADRHHNSFTAVCDQDMEVIFYENGVEKERKVVTKGNPVSINQDEIDIQRERIKLVPLVLSAKTTIESIHRSQGIPAYFGTLEITREEEGLLVVNEVLLEDYLCKVVPSEMPSSYHREALMAQAICARTYAYGKMIKTGLPSLGAHVDDSAGFQVYNNINEQASTTEAVKATHNMIAVYENEPIGTYYYSTSCGVGSDTGVWHGSGENPVYLTAREIGTEAIKNEVSNDMDSREQTDDIAVALRKEEDFKEWITNGKDSHYESGEGWYRWTYEIEEINIAHMEEVLKSRYASNPNLILTQNEEGEFESSEIKELGDIKDIQITKRLTGGVADELVITGEEATVKVLSELNIRYVLSDGVTKVLRQTGDEVNASSTLPSAFIIVEPKKDNDIVTGYKVTGGGFGHGVGMSQNGAKNMAEDGMTCEEIMTFFYPEIELKTLQFKE